jgi:hypothetical protein
MHARVVLGVSASASQRIFAPRAEHQATHACTIARIQMSPTGYLRLMRATSRALYEGRTCIKS